MQTILGANGIIATEIAKTLPRYTSKIRLVSRNPKKVNENDEIFPADLTNPEQAEEAVKGSEVTYLTVGLPYKTKVWQEQWPRIMDNVIDACKKANSRLVFFDNVYLYGKVDGWMTEETPVNPSSHKGEIRAEIARKLMDEAEKGNIQALIARSADFYGPDTPLSVANLMVIENFARGKKAQWMVNADKKHSLTFTPDAGKGTAILGNTESAYNQVWHLPTNKNVLTGKEFIQLAAQAFGTEPKFMVLSKGMIKMAGIFNSLIRENIEMLYQNEYDYLFDSTKFEKAFNYKPADYAEGISETVESAKKKAN